MKKNLKQLVMVLILAIMIFPASVRAEGNNCFGDDLKGADQEAFSTLIDEIQCIKEAHPEFNDERILEIIDQNHTKFERGISDIWNSLTDSEKKLCIRYPFAALKVNTAKNIATSKTESKFGMNGLGDRRITQGTYGILISNKDLGGSLLWCDSLADFLKHT